MKYLSTLIFCIYFILLNSCKESTTSVQEAVTVEGTVLSIFDGGSFELEGAKIRLGEKTATSDSLGRFEFSIDSGIYELSIFSPSHEPYIDTVSLSKNEIIEARLLPSSKGYMIYGTVNTISSGETVPVEGARITLGEHEKVSGSHGDFSFLLEPGIYELQIDSDFYEPYTKTIRIPQIQEYNFDIELISLTKPVQISGTLYDVFEGDTTLIEGARIVVGKKSKESDKNGSFNIIVESGIHELQINSEFHEQYVTSLDITGNEVIDIELKLLEDKELWFPLEEGNKWEYSFNKKVDDDHFDNTYKGILEIELVNKNTSNDGTIYNFKTEQTDTAYIFNFNDNTRDTVITSTVNEIEVHQSNRGVLSVIPYGSNNNRFLPFFGISSTLTHYDYGLRRYVTHNLYSSYPKYYFDGDTLDVISGSPVYPDFITIKKGIGVIYYTHASGHIDKTSISYRLINTSNSEN